MSITRRRYNRFGERTDRAGVTGLSKALTTRPWPEQTITFTDDYAVNLRTGEEHMKLGTIKNDINRMVTRLNRAGSSNECINHVIKTMVDYRGPIGTGRYACTCNNWGPRWIENSADGCCDGCLNWAMDKHYEVPTSKLDPNRVTMEMIERNTWGIRVDVIKKMRAERLALTE